MTLLLRDYQARHEREQRAIMHRIWRSWALGFLIPVAFFFGADWGKKDTAASYQDLLKQMPYACQQSFEKIVVHEVPQ